MPDPKPPTNQFPQQPPPIAQDWQSSQDENGNTKYYSASSEMVYWPDSGTFGQYSPENGLGETWKADSGADMPSWLSQPFQQYAQTQQAQSGPPPIAQDWQQNTDAQGNMHYYSPSIGLVAMPGQDGWSVAQWDPQKGLGQSWNPSQGAPPDWLTGALSSPGNSNTPPSDASISKIQSYGWQQDANGNWFDPKTGDHGMFSPDGSQFINQTKNAALDPNTGQLTTASLVQPWTQKFDPNATYQSGNAFIPNIPAVPNAPGLPQTTAFTPGGGATPTAPDQFKAPDAFKAPTGLTEQNDPGYNFRLQQGLQAVDRGAAAKGMLNSGNTMAAENQYAQDYASGEYQNVYNRALAANTTQFQQASSANQQQFGQAQSENQTAYDRAIAEQQLGYNQNMANYQANYGQQMDVNNTAYNRAQQQYQDQYNIFNQNQSNAFNRYAALAGVGQTATGQLNSAGANYANSVSGLGSQYGSNVANILTGTAQGIGNTIQAGANAQGAAAIAGGNAWGSALGSAGQLGMLPYYSQLFKTQQQPQQQQPMVNAFTFGQ